MSSAFKYWCCCIYPVHCEHFRVIRDTPANFSGFAPRKGPLRLAGCPRLLAKPSVDHVASVSGGTLISRRHHLLRRDRPNPPWGPFSCLHLPRNVRNVLGLRHVWREGHGLYSFLRWQRLSLT